MPPVDRKTSKQRRAAVGLAIPAPFVRKKLPNARATDKVKLLPVSMLSRFGLIRKKLSRRKDRKRSFSRLSDLV